VSAIAPIFNRLVIFSITDTAYHGHPNPLETPPGIARRSLALYYYSVDRPAEEQTEAHSTLWQPGVGERMPRPGDAPAQLTPAARSAKEVLRDWVPPVVLRAVRRPRRR
jgi:hypothetical protein